jgi:hypothetical protein
MGLRWGPPTSLYSAATLTRGGARAYLSKTPASTVFSFTLLVLSNLLFAADACSYAINAQGHNRRIMHNPQKTYCFFFYCYLSN